MEENINPNEKQSQSQCNKILAYLKTGKKITALEALNRFGCMRLSARILDLREQGYPITDEMMKDPNSGKRYKAYWLMETV
ncbi:hypothetical protein C3007_07075 [Avibacterium gallinarum]|uniref:Helix-turn-helix protein n=1 Tax=Avibacterium gallinarum TaxID=755 RepID=A0A379B027_AVIGA|nr:helix-turn-helix domain-containing protein [Avibacterium gallinarum]POY44073.1 hypothetical protein C3007_07075 [Avibacterium gallinarum]TDP29125.1 helix-turn-helix protein [Avibacterium gallinarum]SUB28448.1 Uncharacterised protein [Avibacterium gallinarum]